MSIILAAISFFTAILSAVTGMAGGIVLLSLMTFILPLNIIIPIHGIVQLVSNSTRCFLLRRSIRFDFAIPFYLGLPLGTYTSYKVVQLMPGPTIPLALIAGLIFYTVFKPKNLPSIHIPKWSFFILGFVLGSLSLLVGAIGPILAPFFLRDDLKKEEIVATKGFSQMGGHLLKIPAFLALGFDYQNYALVLVLMCLSTIIGTQVGVKILSNIKESLFKTIFKLALFIAGVRILYNISLPFLIP